MWQQIEYTKDDEIPPPRDCHAAVLYDHEMYVMFGGTGFTWLKDIFAYNCITRRWRKIRDTTGERPMGRAGHSACVYGDKVIVFGGWNGRRTLNDMFEYCFTTNRWEHIEYDSYIAPAPRDSHAAVIANGCMYVVGGGDGAIRLNDMWEYHIESRTWRQFNCMGQVTAGRAGHVCCLYKNFDESKIIMFGGGNGESKDGWMTEIFECDLVARKWTLIETPNGEKSSPGAYGLSAIIHKNSMYVFGGGDGMNWFNTVYQYNIDESHNRKCVKKVMQSSLQKKHFCDVDVVCCEDDEQVPAKHDSDGDEDMEDCCDWPSSGAAAACSTSTYSYPIVFNTPPSPSAAAAASGQHAPAVRMKKRSRDEGMELFGSPQRNRAVSGGGGIMATAAKRVASVFSRLLPDDDEE